MNRNNIKESCKSEEGLKELMEYCEVDFFDPIDSMEKTIRGGIPSEIPEEANELLTKLTGYFMGLLRILGIVENARNKIWSDCYTRLKAEKKKAGEKFTNAVGERTANAEVLNYDRFINILEKYVTSANKGSSKLQSTLNWHKSLKSREE